MSPSKLFPILLAIVIFVSACQDDQPINDSENLPVQLSCKVVDANANPPQYAVYAVVNYNKVKIATLSACDSIPPERFENYQVPKEAIAAVGGWQQSNGAVIYTIQEGNGLAFYRSLLTKEADGQTADLNTVSIGTFSDGKFDLRLLLRLEDLPGTYALSKEEGSHILFVGMRNDTLVAEYFTMSGILPPVNQLNLMMSAMESRVLNNFQVQLPGMQFTSDQFKGRFVEKESGSIDLIMEGDQQYTLHKILAEDYSIPVE